MQFSRADDIRPYRIVLICNIVVIAYRSHLHLQIPIRHSTCHRQETKPLQMPPITRLLKFTVRFLTHLP